jgi:hypothetical protein
MVYGHEESDFAIVAVKPANKVAHFALEQSAMGPAAAEPVDELKENAAPGVDRLTWTDYEAGLGTVRNLVCEAMMMRTDGASYGGAGDSCSSLLLPSSSVAKSVTSCPS